MEPTQSEVIATPLSTRIVIYVKASPGKTTQEIATALSVPYVKVRNAMKFLARRGVADADGLFKKEPQIVPHKKGPGARYYERDSLDLLGDNFDAK